MLENLYYAFLAIIIPALYLVLGIFYKAKTPAFGSGMGLKTKMTTRSQKTWDFAHKFASKLFIVYAVILGILCAAWFIIPWEEEMRSTAFWCYVGVEFLSILSLIPLINRDIRNKLNLRWVK